MLEHHKLSKMLKRPCPKCKEKGKNIKFIHVGIFMYQCPECGYNLFIDLPIENFDNREWGFYNKDLEGS